MEPKQNRKRQKPRNKKSQNQNPQNQNPQDQRLQTEKQLTENAKTKPLPARPSLEHLKKQAKQLLKGHQAADKGALNLIQEHHPRWKTTAEAAIKAAPFALNDAQMVIAKQYGFENWAKLKEHVLLHEAAPASDADIRALRGAAARGDLEKLNALLDANPELLNEPGGPGVRTALHDAAGSGQEAAVKFLLERGADPNIRCEGDNAFPIHFAAEKQHFPIIRLLVEHGADTIGEGDYHELGVLGWATAWDYVDSSRGIVREIVDYLLAHGARHNIFSAVAMGEMEVVRKLVAQSPADLERRMDMGSKRRRPLHLAVIKKQAGVLKALLDLGANMESIDEAGFTALDQAGLNCEKEIAQILLDRGAKVRLPAAIALGRTHDVERLLRREPDALKPGNRWGNLIVRAAERAPGEVVKALIAAGADVNVRDDPKTAVDLTSGYTPLHAAGFRGNMSAASVLMKHGANVSVREEKYHGTPAGWASYAGHNDIRDLIITGPVDMMEAVENGLTERIKEIIEQEPRAVDRPFRDYPLFPLYAEGWYTPLAFAVVRGQTETVRALMDHGADAMQRSPDGKTLAEIASDNGHAEIARMLKQRE